MSLTSSAAMADFVRRRLTSLLQNPDGWGPPHAVELQLLLLLEMWLVVAGAPQETVDAVAERYQRFLSRELPGPPLPLSLRLRLGNESSPEFVRFLRKFVLAEQLRHREDSLVRSASAPTLPLTDAPGRLHFVET